MTQAQSGDMVKIHYTGTLDVDTEFDSSSGREPLEFALGGGQVIPGFENAVSGMAVGDHNTVTLDANHPLAGQALTFAIELVEIA